MRLIQRGVHVHFREPGYAHKETWETGTASAAMGGVTTVFANNPPTGTLPAREMKEAATKAYVNYGIYGLLAEDNLDQLGVFAKIIPITSAADGSLQNRLDLLN